MLSGWGRHCSLIGSCPWDSDRGFGQHESALKLKQMMQVHTDSYSTLEGLGCPLSVVRVNTTAILLEGLREQLYLRVLEADLNTYGTARVLLAP